MKIAFFEVQMEWDASWVPGSFLDDIIFNLLIDVNVNDEVCRPNV